MSNIDLHVGVLAVLVVLAGVVVVGTTSVSVAAQDADDTDANATNVTQPEPPGLGLGHEISIALRSQREYIEGAVERESFRLSFKNASETNRSRVAKREVERIHSEISDAYQERKRLIEELQNGNISPTEFAMKMAEINMRVSEAARSLGHVENVSERRNVSLNRSRLNRTRGLARGIVGNETPTRPRGAGAVEVARRAMSLARNASNMTGHEVAQRARNLSRDRVHAPPVDTTNRTDRVPDRGQQADNMNGSGSNGAQQGSQGMNRGQNSDRGGGGGRGNPGSNGAVGMDGQGEGGDGR
ncbi:MAG: hypothetical protein SV253_08765 [Halobacteria archaeon]|nr:hypothetical protein [Halobacteria archaeon]